MTKATKQNEAANVAKEDNAPATATVLFTGSVSVTKQHIIVAPCQQTFNKERWFQKKHLANFSKSPKGVSIEARKSYLVNKVEGIEAD